MGKIHFVLENTLNEIQISPNRLATESKVRHHTVYAMVRNDTKSIKLDTLILLLDTLNRLAKEENIPRRIQVSDVFIYVD